MQPLLQHFTRRYKKQKKEKEAKAHKKIHIDKNTKNNNTVKEKKKKEDLQPLNQTAHK